MEKVWATTYVLLYLNYDIEGDFESRFEWNTTKVLEFLNKFFKQQGDADEHT